MADTSAMPFNQKLYCSFPAAPGQKLGVAVHLP